MKEKAKEYFKERRVIPINDYELAEFATNMLKEVFKELENKKISVVCNRTLLGVVPAKDIDNLIEKYLGDQDES